MRKNDSARICSFPILLAVFAALTLMPPPDLAQINASPVGNADSSNVTAMPKDLKALMRLAGESNSLIGTDVQPWHLKASFTALDTNGNVIDEGTYEEYWAAPRKSKVSFISRSFNQTNWVTEKGTMRSGVHSNPPNLFAMTGIEFSSPIFVNPNLLDHWVLDKKEQRTDGVKQLCVEIKGLSTASGTNPFDGPSYCFDTDRPLLRNNENPNDGTLWVRSHIVSFQGKYVAGEFQAVQMDKPILKVHLDTLELLPADQDAVFTPPADATFLPLKVNISGGVAQSMLVHVSPPHYPPEAKQAGITGTVVMQATIGKDGHVADVQVISGPQELQQAALDCVRGWIYRPYLLNGDPVEVHTTINVVFTLGR